jgi:hypothetical protein
MSYIFYQRAGNRLLIIFVFLLIIMITSCGPSPEVFSTQTALAWTATRTLTQTSTPSATHTLTPTSTKTSTPTLTPTPTPWGGARGLVFTYKQRGYYSAFKLRGESNIFYASIDGSELKPITNNGLLGTSEVKGVSVDGTQVLIISSSDIWFRNNSHLYIANIDGSFISPLTKNISQVDDAAWLSNGKIAYIANNHIFIINPDGSGIIRDDWSHQPNHFPLRIEGISQNRLIFREAIGSLHPSYSPLGLMWMMMDGSGEVGELDYGGINRNLDITMSPDGNEVTWFDYYIADRKVLYSTIVEGGTNIGIDNSNIKSVPFPQVEDGYVGDAYMQWSNDGKKLWIIRQFGVHVGPGKYDYSKNYDFFLWSEDEQKLYNFPEITIQDAKGGFWPIYDILSPDGGQVLLTDHGEYIAIVNLSTKQVSRELGCVLSTLCPPKPNLIQPNDWYAYERLLLIDSVFWVPAVY